MGSGKYFILLKSNILKLLSKSIVAVGVVTKNLFPTIFQKNFSNNLVWIPRYS